MTVKEFKELVLEAEKKGEINENSEIFVLDDDQLVMSEPALFTDSNRNLVLKYSNISRRTWYCFKNFF